ncbi:tetratricopeptide repeat protein [Thaumasiovibrio subtropicus]|uniref:tetratricopeptide repeat protein n=1 Tax=Thaumasiovibrio subtropicus TaxID=1891207 RepID=UPI000B357599|nr:hypothetical protein [Thaumasiovibrio subtropicus]
MKTVILIIALSLGLSSTAWSAELTQQTATRVQRAQKLQQDDKIREAIDVLKSVSPSRAFDKAYVDRMLGILYWQNDQPNQAVTRLTRAINSGELPKKEVPTTRQMVADILLMQQQYRKALPHYYKLTSEYAERAKRSMAWLRISQSHYQLEEWEKVLAGLKSYRANNGRMKVEHYRMTLGSQLPLKHYKGAAATLEILIKIEPKEVMWFQRLAGIQMQLGRYKGAMQTLAIAHHNGLNLMRQDKLTLVQLYGQQGMPERAARLYTTLNPTSSRELATLATYWQMAKEWDKAIAVFERAAAKDNKHRLKLALLQMQQRDFSAALSNLNRVNNPNSEQVLMAKIQILYSTGDISGALRVAQQAYSKTASKSSQSWIKYLSNLDTQSSSV